MCARPPGFALVVGDHHHRGAGAVQVQQDIHHLGAHLAVEVTGRLVRQQHLRLAHHRAGDRHPLLLAARQLARIMVHARAQADPFERLARRLAPLRRAHAAVQQRQLDVVDHAQVGDQVEALKDEPEGRCAAGRPACRGRTSSECRRWRRCRGRGGPTGRSGSARCSCRSRKGPSCRRIRPSSHAGRCLSKPASRPCRSGRSC